MVVNWQVQMEGCAWFVADIIVTLKLGKMWLWAQHFEKKKISSVLFSFF